MTDRAAPSPVSVTPPVTVTVSADRRRLTVSDERLGLADRFHALWLRDACACPACRRPSTGERLLDPTTVDPDVAIVDVEPIDPDRDRLAITFTDGHRSTITTRFLLDHSPVARDRRSRPMAGRSMWDGTPPAFFERGECDDDMVLRDLVNTLWHRGAAVVRAVEPTEEGLLSTAALIGHVLPSNYGFTWSIEATVAPVSEVDSQHGLRVHTDLPYRRSPPGLQLILAATTDVAGGASTLTDGFSMAERLRVDDPTTWRILTTVPFVYPYDRPGVSLHGASPLISLQADGSYRDVRRAPDLVGSPIVDADDAPALYRALARWSALLDDPANQAEVRLEVGDVLAFDNHRVLHGRTAFDLGAAGRRRLLGCYLDIDELANRRAVLNAADDAAAVEGSGSGG
ncbi:MAG: TauD/TfdA family dioxygenase [Acidimicrobiia bacterium]|nr:TauD/TfdA family dioxygenase [Acidimicrobiia bacterium]MDH5519703.1 TauD/TfdA family dioxygenase [Acidimicrobiia bacterium]